MLFTKLQRIAFASILYCLRKYVRYNFKKKCISIGQKLANCILKTHQRTLDYIDEANIDNLCIIGESKRCQEEKLKRFVLERKRVRASLGLAPIYIYE